MNKRTYLENAIFREISNNRVIYYYETLFVSHIYSTKLKISTPEKNYFNLYVRELADLTINDFKTIADEYDNKIFQFKITEMRSSAKLILLKTESIILKYLSELNQNSINSDDLKLYNHLAYEFRNQMRKF